MGGVLALPPCRPKNFTKRFRLSSSLGLRLSHLCSVRLHSGQKQMTTAAGFHCRSCRLAKAGLRTGLRSSMRCTSRMGGLRIITASTGKLPVRRVRIRVAIQLHAVLRSCADMLSLPSALVFHHVDLSTAKGARLRVPTSVFNPSSYTCRIGMLLLAPSGRQERRQYHTAFCRSRCRLRCRAQKSSLHFTFLSGKIREDMRTRLVYKGSGGVQGVRLPCRRGFDRTTANCLLEMPTFGCRSHVTITSVGDRLSLGKRVSDSSLGTYLAGPLGLSIS